MPARWTQRRCQSVQGQRQGPTVNTEYCAPQLWSPGPLCQRVLEECAAGSAGAGVTGAAGHAPDAVEPGLRGHAAPVCAAARGSSPSSRGRERPQEEVRKEEFSFQPQDKFCRPEIK